MLFMTAHFVGEIVLAFDRPIDGVETANAAAARVDVVSASSSALRRELAQTFTPPPDFPSL